MKRKAPKRKTKSTPAKTTSPSSSPSANPSAHESPKQSPNQSPTQSWVPGVEDNKLKQLLAARAKLAIRDVRPANPKAGTPGFIFMRPPCHGYDCPNWPPNHPTDPCAGQDWVWQPDIAIKVITLSSSCPSDAQLSLISQGVAGNLSNLELPNPDVRVSCTAGTIFILIWGTRVVAGSCDDKARDRAQVPSDIANDGNFGIYISAGLIRQLAQSAFDAMPKRLDGQGNPDPGGPIHLTGLSVDFTQPGSGATNIVTTNVTGYDERPWPDASFTNTITDQLEAMLQSTSSSSTDVSDWDEFLDVLLGILQVVVPPLLPLSDFSLFTELEISQPNNPPTGGVGAKVVAALPTEISLPESGGIIDPFPVFSPGVSARLAAIPPGLLPTRQKLVLAYNVPRVDSRGILISGMLDTQTRTPQVAISGPATLSLDSAAVSTFGYYQAQPQDFYGKLTYAWSAGASPTNTKGARFTFDRGTAKAGSSFVRNISLRVTDQEGSSASATLPVTIYVTNESDNLPPVCKVKPWLPQCHPGV